MGQTKQRNTYPQIMHLKRVEKIKAIQEAHRRIVKEHDVRQRKRKICTRRIEIEYYKKGFSKKIKVKRKYNIDLVG